MKIGNRKEFQSWRFLFLSDEGLTLETSDFKLLDLLLDSKLFTLADFHNQLSS